MSITNTHGAYRPAQFAIIASCIFWASEWTAGAATTVATDHHSAGAAAIDQQRQLQPKQLGKSFLQICSQQEMSPERVIQGVATALDLPITHITVLDIAEVDSVANALKLAQRQQHAQSIEQLVSWPWTKPNSVRKESLSISDAFHHGAKRSSPRKMLQPASGTDLSTARVPWQALELCLRTPNAQELQAQLARAAGNGSLVAALEAVSAFVPDPSTGPRGLMMTLRTRSIEDLAAFALGQNERQGNDGNFAAFLVNSVRMQPDAGSIRIFLMGAFLASIGVGLVVYSLLAGVCCKHEHDDAAQQFIAAGQQPLKLQTARTPQPDCGRHKAYKTQLNTKWLLRPSRSGKFVVRPRRKLVRLLKAKVCKQ